MNIERPPGSEKERDRELAQIRQKAEEYQRAHPIAKCFRCGAQTLPLIPLTNGWNCTPCVEVLLAKQGGDSLSKSRDAAWDAANEATRELRETREQIAKLEGELKARVEVAEHEAAATVWDEVAKLALFGPIVPGYCASRARLEREAAAALREKGTS